MDGKIQEPTGCFISPRTKSFQDYFAKKLDILGLSKIIQAFKVYLLGFCWIRKTGFGIELPNFDWKIIQAQMPELSWIFAWISPIRGWIR